MINSNFFLGYAEDFNGICFVYPPKVKEILQGENAAYGKILTMSQEDLDDLYIENNIEGEAPKPFDYLFTAAASDEELVKKAFYFFIHEKVIFLYDKRMIIIGAPQEIKSMQDLRIINEENFFNFQNIVRAALGEQVKEPYDYNMHPKVKKMKAKARYRDRIKAKQNGLNLGSMLASICCMGLGLNPLNIGEISYACVPALIRYYQEKDKYETDIASLLAGAKVEPKYWVRNIKDDDK